MKQGETSKKIKPPPFYVSLIIGDKIVHNCMIYSRASSFVIPRYVANLMGIKYEPMVRDVLQLDGSSSKTVGVLKQVEMALHAFLGCTLTLDISITNLKLHFVIYLLRDFTTKIGGIFHLIGLTYFLEQGMEQNIP